MTMYPCCSRAIGLTTASSFKGDKAMQYDVVIVGACTAGTYFSNLLGKAGLRVLVIDKSTEENLRKEDICRAPKYLTSNIY